MLLGDQVMLHPGALVRVIGEPGMVDVGPQLLGRAVDGTARPIDGGKRPHPDHRWPLGGRREGALERSSITESFDRSEEHTSELQSLMRISYAVFCLKKKKITQKKNTRSHT